MIESDVFIPQDAAASFVKGIVRPAASAMAVNLKPNLHKKRYATGLKEWGLALHADLPIEADLS